MPKVSVIISVSNVEKYMRECLESVINQTLKDIEIICANDCSTDSSSEILREYASRDNRIKIINQENLGAGAVKNKSLEIAKGEYIGFVDSDDRIELSYFEQLYNASLINHADIIFQTKIVEVNSKTNEQKEIETETGNNDIELRFNIINQSEHPYSKIFKKEFIEKYNLRFAHTVHSEDIFFIIPAILLAKQITYIDNAGYFYRKNCSLSQTSYTKKDLEELAVSFSAIYDIVNRYIPNLKSLVNLKENIICNRIYNDLNETDRTFFEGFIKNKHYIDFEQKGGISGFKTVIKNPSPDNISKLWWGDYWLGLDLAAGLKAIGYNVSTDYYPEFSEGKDDINIVIRGLYEYKNINKKKINILYIISNCERIKRSELENYNIIISASKKIYYNLKNKYNIHYLPQFTNPDRFFCCKDDKYKNKILFAGNRYTHRSAVQYAINNNFPVSIYGKYWEDKADKKFIKGLYIDNNELHKYYSNADIILNDTYVFMRQNGFIPNRIFDATACKGFVISDYIPEIEEIYGNSIPMYRNEKEFVELITYYSSHPEERIEKAEHAYKITMKEYTVQTFARKLDKILKNYKNNIMRRIISFLPSIEEIFPPKTKSR